MIDFLNGIGSIAPFLPIKRSSLGTRIRTAEKSSAACTSMYLCRSSVRTLKGINTNSSLTALSSSMSPRDYLKSYIENRKASW